MLPVRIFVTPGGFCCLKEHCVACCLSCFLGKKNIMPCPGHLLLNSRKDPVLHIWISSVWEIPVYFKQTDQIWWECLQQMYDLWMMLLHKAVHCPATDSMRKTLSMFINVWNSSVQYILQSRHVIFRREKDTLSPTFVGKYNISY